MNGFFKVNDIYGHSGDIMADSGEEDDRLQYQHHQQETDPEDHHNNQQRCDWNYVMDEIR